MNKEKEPIPNTDESGYGEQKNDLLIDRKMGKGLSSTNFNNILFSKRGNKKKKDR